MTEEMSKNQRPTLSLERDKQRSECRSLQSEFRAVLGRIYEMLGTAWTVLPPRPGIPKMFPPGNMHIIPAFPRRSGVQEGGAWGAGELVIFPLYVPL